MEPRSKSLPSYFVAIVFAAVLIALPACASQTASQAADSGTAGASKEQAPSINNAAQSESSSNSGMKAVEIDDETMALIEGTWRAKGVWFDASDPIKPLEENKNLNDQYGRHSITFNEDKTFEYQKRDALEKGVWEYYGLESGMHGFAMKKTSASRTGDGGGAIRSESDLDGAAIYLVFLREINSGNLIIVHEQGNENADAKLVMSKVAGSAQVASGSASTSPAPYANHTATTGEKNALGKAISYLDMMAFSYSGLIKQLEFEGFTHSEAVYGADNCGANWNEQAERKARQYLDMTSFSRSRLIEQLEFEGFTHSQAEYGVSKAY